jgi:hypothetical protein
VFWVFLLLLPAVRGQTAQQSEWQQQQQQVREAARPVQRYTPAAGGRAVVSAGWDGPPTTAHTTALGDNPLPQQSRPRNDGHASEHQSNAVAPARRLSAASQAPVTATGPGAQTLTTDITRQGCPSAAMVLSAPGCTCTVYHTEPGQGSAASSRRSDVRSNVCPSGYRCSPSAAAAIFAAGWSRNSTSGAAPAVDGFTTERGICIPCQLGEHGSSSSQLLTYQHTALSQEPPAWSPTPVAQAQDRGFVWYQCIKQPLLSDTFLCTAVCRMQGSTALWGPKRRRCSAC